MEKINSDELLVKILSFLPTKVAVSTSVLSKRWEFLWMWVPKLGYDDNELSGESQIQRMRRFIDRNLPLHKSPVIESLHLKFQTAPFQIQPEDIKLWVAYAVFRLVQDLSINYYCGKSNPNGNPNALLPSSLYNCKTLVTLKLEGKILVDAPRIVCLPCLKTLHLGRVRYAEEESFQQLLSNCPVLEDLIVERCQDDNLRKFAIMARSLLRLTFTDLEVISSECEYVIDTPSLKYFKTIKLSINNSRLILNMPNLDEAFIAVLGFSDIKKLLKPITSVKRLSLLLLFTDFDSAEVVSGEDIVFNELEHLKFCISYHSYWSKLLLWLLKGSPKLRHLEFDELENIARDGMNTLVNWKQLIFVPQCLLSSLQTFKWKADCPTAEGRDMVTYILRNSCRLKTATITFGSRWDSQKKLELIKDLAYSSRGSTTCNLVFG